MKNCILKEEKDINNQRKITKYQETEEKFKESWNSSSQ